MTRSVSPIRDFAIGIYDGPHATPKPSSDGPIFLGIKNVAEDGRLDFSEIRHVSEAEFPKWTRRVKPQKDDIVFSYEATLHRYARIPDGFEGCLGRRMALVRPDPSKVDPRFLHYYFLSPVWRAKMDAITINGATVNRIPLTNFPDTKVSFPGLSEQATIANILSAYDDLIENNRRRIALLEEAARMFYREWFVHFRFPGHEHVKITDGLPEGWEKLELGRLCSLRAGGVFKPKYQGNLSGDFPFIKVRDMNSPGNLIIITEADNWVTSDACEEFRGRPFPSGTSVFAKIGEALRQNRLRFLVRETLIDNNMMGAVPNRELIEGTFLYYMLSTYDLASHASGAAVPFLSAKVLSQIRFLVPPPTVQQHFSDVAAPAFQQIAILQRQNREAAKARDLLLPRLMNGEIAV